MKQSISYYLTLLVIKLKGLKKTFSQDPIDFKKIRKEDIHKPTSSFYKKNISREFKVADTAITEISTTATSDKLLLYIHGGALISGPAQHHWESIKTIAQHCSHTIWMCNYPKAPEHKISEISENIDAVYTTALDTYSAHKIVLVGDSVGGLLATSLVQRLIAKNIATPHKIILISPVMDASMTNPNIAAVDAVDPMLSKQGVLSAKKMAAGDIDLKDTLISPLYGDFENFPPTALFLAENDITYPDQQIVVKKLKNAKVALEIIEGKNMPHIWPLLPVMKEAKTALKEIIRILNVS